MGDINDSEAQRLDGEDRPAVVSALWSARDPGRFCTVLRATPSTYLVEFTDQPLVVADPPCLELDWSSPEGEARVWRLRRSSTQTQARVRRRLARW